MIEVFSSFISGLFGLGLVLFLLHTIYSRNSNHWRYLADHYGGVWREPSVEKWGYLNLYGKFPVSKGYNSSFKIGLHQEGITLRMIIPPDSFYCKPLFIPYGDIKGWNQSWYLNAESVELELKNATEVKLVMPRSEIDWIKSFGGKTVNIDDVQSPNKDKPVIWHTFLVFWPIFVIGSLGVIGLIKLFSW